MDTPSQALVVKITERLVREGLVTAEAAKRIQPKIAEGKLRAVSIIPSGKQKAPSFLITADNEKCFFIFNPWNL